MRIQANDECEILTLIKAKVNSTNNKQMLTRGLSILNQKQPQELLYLCHLSHESDQMIYKQPSDGVIAEYLISKRLRKLISSGDLPSV